MSVDNQDKLNLLQDLLIEEFIVRIRSGEASAAELSSARQLLKDNNISAIMSDDSPLAELVKSLPFHDKGVDRILTN